MLARVFADITGGFYVDVGAQDPVIDSVTKSFYERGWRGINIEPVPHWFERIREDRALDINLMCAVGASDGELVLYESTDSGLTTAIAEYAARHEAAGRAMVERTVPMKRLDTILDKHAPEEMHFLKIDVEGMEKEVLAGLSLARHRPWVLMVECTRPNTAVDVSDVWEASVLGAGYRLAYRDGLNRFYLAQEHMSRAAAFELPPNVFDDFISYREVAGNEYARSLESRVQALHDSAETLRAHLLTVTDTAVARQHRIEELDVVLAERQRIAETYRTDLLQVSATADARQQRIGELESALAERQAVLESTARTAEAYRAELLQVSEAASARQQRIEELDQTLLGHQQMLDEAMRIAESYRADLLQVSETASARQQRIEELDQAVLALYSRLDEALLAAESNRVDLHKVAEAAENRRRLIEVLETRLADRERELRSSISLRSAQQLEIDRVYASRSWRLTAPLRASTGLARRIAGRGLRMASAIPVVRWVAGRVLKGGTKQRLLRLAGFQPAAEVAEAVEAAAPGRDSGHLEISRAGRRVHRLLAAINERRVHDKR